MTKLPTSPGPSPSGFNIAIALPEAPIQIDDDDAAEAADAPPAAPRENAWSFLTKLRLSGFGGVNRFGFGA